jgi:hypothetical protein
MKEIKDYGGEFQPNLKLEDFSKEGLIQLVRAAAKLYGGLNQYWYKAVKDKLGEEAANQIQEYVWVKKGASEAEINTVCNAMNITGSDVSSYFKFFQCTPVNATMIDMVFELKDHDHGILTVTRCAPLQVWERNHEPGIQKHMCEVVERMGFQIGATMFNPRMKTTPIKLPPRQSKKDIACQWLFEVV